jgi:hypothetical protein
VKTTLFALWLTLNCGLALAEPPQKVVLVIFENTNYSGAIAQPFFNQFAQLGLLLTNFHAIGHPSLPNYIALVAGDTFNVSDDERVNLNQNHLGDLLEAKDKSWHVYAEQYPGSCFLGDAKSTYVRRHNPFISFTNIQKDPVRCANITDSTNFIADFNARKLADFTMYIPDLNNDGHDTGVAYADRWFNSTFGQLLRDPNAMNGVLLIVVFDEDDDGPDNHIYAAMTGAGVTAGTQLAMPLTHYNLLRTIEDLFQLGNLGRSDASAPGISFK